MIIPPIIVSLADNCQKLMNFAHLQSQTKSPWYQCMYRVWIKSLDIYSLSSRNKNMSWADNSVKIWWNLPISNPKPGPHNSHIKFGENRLTFTQVIIQKRNTDRCTTDGWTDRYTDIQHETVIPHHYDWHGKKINKKMHMGKWRMEFRERLGLLDKGDKLSINNMI